MLWISGHALLPTSLSTDHYPAFWSCNTNYRPLWRHRDCKTAIKTNIYRQKNYARCLGWPAAGIAYSYTSLCFFWQHSDIHVYVSFGSIQIYMSMLNEGLISGAAFCTAERTLVRFITDTQRYKRTDKNCLACDGTRPIWDVKNKRCAGHSWHLRRVW